MRWCAPAAMATAAVPAAKLLVLLTPLIPLPPLPFVRLPLGLDALREFPKRLVSILKRSEAATGCEAG
eukprot:CAMPEP_0119183860 /NCGR_PEP_ID=MMETSP1315-20130426/65152_1 /TAXON_ID=676789 /ORGANISM="Prasinoderma singularis, Strain RCC927" /LENGTH=67 /DNA_ID=CAMNT_0007178249 /DNA_START=52 /DNA_END=251 /DNA_ORIENTATION=+